MSKHGPKASEYDQENTPITDYRPANGIERERYEHRQPHDSKYAIKVVKQPAFSSSAR